MRGLTIQNALRFLALLLVQVLVLNHVYLGGFITPYLYVLFILMLPTSTPKMLMVLLGFLSGLSVDIFSNMPGIHCASATLAAFLRVVYADRILKRDSNNDINTPSIASVGFRPWAVYSALLLLAYHFTYSALELFSAHGLLRTLFQATLSALATWLLCILTLTLFRDKRHAAAIVTLIILNTQAAYCQTAIGTWRDGLSYGKVTSVAVAGDAGQYHVYAAADKALFYYDRRQDGITRLSKADGLSDAGIAAIACHQPTGSLIIAYNNSNIDIITASGRITNLSDIKRNNIYADKKIHSIRFNGHRAYLACGFGIVCLDMQRQEVEDTYILNNVARPLAVYDIAFTDSLIIAATADGIYTAHAHTRFLHIADNWHRDIASLLSGTSINSLAIAGTNIVALTANVADTTAYISPIAGFPAWAPFLSGSIRRITASHDKLIVIWSDSLTIYSAEPQRKLSIGTIDWLTMDANDAAFSPDGSLWTAHNWAGLASYSDIHNTTKINTYCPQGPASSSVFRLKSFRDRVLVAPGGKSSTYTNSYYPAQLSTCRGLSWNSLNRNEILETAYDIIDAAVNPNDTTEIIAASWGNGILRISDNQVVQLYDASNTGGAVEPYQQGQYRTTRTGAVAFDSKGNCWVTNSLVNKTIAVRLANGTWQGFDTRSVVAGGETDKILWDSVNNYIWFAGSANRIYVLDAEKALRTDQPPLAYIDPNNGAKLETANVNCLTQDHSGHIWLGTNKGIKVIYDGYRAFKNGGQGELAPVSCSNILFQGIDPVTGTYQTEYLMAYENVTAIAVDGANRKWVGTATGGVYLLSATGLEQLQHFTPSNSPLLSNNILSIAIQPRNGEVFIATDQGLIIYRSTATYAGSSISDNIYAFPNPVRPDYNGPVAIKGFSRNALIHITDVSGHVVYAGNAFGGQAVWNLRTPTGSRAASGIYFVFATDEDGNNRAVTKILVISN